MVACQSNDFKSVRLLFEQGVDLDQVDWVSWLFTFTCYLRAAKFTALTLHLLTYKQEGNTALFYAIRHSAIHCMLMLIRYGCNYQHCNSMGNNLLFVATEYCAHSIVDYLLHCGVSTCHVNNDGNSLLLYAMTCQRWDLVDLLLARNVEVQHRNVQGENALDIAYRCNRESLIALLTSYNCSDCDHDRHVMDDLDISLEEKMNAEPDESLESITTKTMAISMTELPSSSL